MSHTPEEWVATPVSQGDSISWTVVGPDANALIGSEANARLIAAAPDLLHACKRAIAGKWCSPKTCVAGGCVCNVMADAIAKAEGK